MENGMENGMENNIKSGADAGFEAWINSGFDNGDNEDNRDNGDNGIIKAEKADAAPPDAARALYSETVRRRRRGKSRVYTRFVLAAVCAASILGGLFIGIGLSAGYAFFSSRAGFNGAAPAAPPDPVRVSSAPQAASETPAAGGGANAAPAASVSAAIQKARPCVVAVTAEQSAPNDLNAPRAGAISGVVFSEDDSRVYIVTAYDGIRSADGIQARWQSKPPVAASVVDYDAQCDLAVICVSKDDLKKQGVDSVTVATFTDSGGDDIGQPVLALGASPDGGSVATDGIISAIETSATLGGDRKLTLLQTTAVITRANSGGPLIDMNGQIIGINSGVLQPDQSEDIFNYCIPANNAAPIIQALLERVNRPVLGITGSDVSADEAAKLKLPQAGAYVLSVAKGSPAEKAGLKPDDIIASFDNKPVLNMSQLVSMVGSAQPDKELNLGVVRNGKPVTLKVVLKKYSDVNN